MLTNEAAGGLVSEQLRRMREELKKSPGAVLMPPCVLPLDEQQVDIVLFEVVLVKIANSSRFN